jgi:DNA-binding XRE family transcriptional regulator/KaiC/GvpD/RAD55 family RecA-like ATPase
MNPSSVKNFSTGVSPLDQIMGGLMIGDNVLWYDDAGSLAGIFCTNFLMASKAAGRPFIYVSLDRSPRNLLDKLGPLAEYEKLTILDCFTHGKGKGAKTFLAFYDKTYLEWPCQIVAVLDPHEPDHLMQAFMDVQTSMEGDIHFIFESITGMQELWKGEDAISRFYAHTCPRLYELNAIGYWIIEKNAHSKRLRALINQVAQVIIELTLKRGRTSLSVIKAEKREIDHVNTPYGYSTKGLTVSFDAERPFSEQMDLGGRIRRYRSKRGLSQSEIARQVGVTPSSISQMENNQIYPSLPALFKIAEVLGTDMSQFFSNGPDEKPQTIYCGVDSVPIQPPNISPRCVTVCRQIPETASSTASVYLIEISPGKEIQSHFFTHKAEELGYVLDGKVEMTLGGETHIVRTGSMIHLMGEIPTVWRNPGVHSARLLWIKIK